MQALTGYTLTVTRGPRAGLVKHYHSTKRRVARNFADKLDQEYGAICASVRPVFAPLEHKPDALETLIAFGAP